VDANSLSDEFRISRQRATAQFRGAGIEKDAALVGFTPVFTPPRRRLRMHTETIVAFFCSIVAALLIACSFWLIITHSHGAGSGAAVPAIKSERRLFDRDIETKMSR
jgi:hypothetical protein